MTMVTECLERQLPEFEKKLGSMKMTFEDDIRHMMEVKGNPIRKNNENLLYRKDLSMSEKLEELNRRNRPHRQSREQERSLDRTPIAGDIYQISPRYLSSYSKYLLSKVFKYSSSSFSLFVQSKARVSRRSYSLNTRLYYRSVFVQRIERGSRATPTA